MSTSINKNASLQPFTPILSSYIIIEEDGMISYSSPEWENQRTNGSALSAILPTVGSKFLQSCQQYMKPKNHQEIQSVLQGEHPSFYGNCVLEFDENQYQLQFQILRIQLKPRQFLLSLLTHKGSVISENFYQEIVETLPQMVVVFDPAGYIIECNQQLRDFLSVEEPTINTHRVIDLLAPANHRVILRAMSELRQNGALANPVIKLTRSDETEVILHCNISIEKDALGKIIYVTMVLDDITETTQTKAELKHAENFLQRLVVDAPFGVFTVDRDLKIVFQNQPMTRIINSLQAVVIPTIGKRVTEILQVDPTEVAASIRELKAGRSVIGKTIHFPPTNNRSLSLEVNAAPIIDAKGEWDGAVIIATNITDQLATEKTLRKQLDTLKILHAVSSACSSATSEDQIITEVTDIINQSFYPDHFGMVMYDETYGCLKIHPSYRGIKELKPEIYIPRGKGVVWEVFESRKSQRIPDVSNTSAYYESTSGVKSELCVPIIVGDQILGVINAESTQYDFFSEDDERLLLTLAGQLAIAIDRIRQQVSERQQRELAEVMQQIARSLSVSLDFNEVMDRILDAVEQLVPHDASGIFLIDGDEFYLLQQRSYKKYGAEEWVTTTRFKINDLPSVKKLVETQLPVLIPDVDTNESWVHFPETDWIKSYVEIPLWSGKEIIGFLSLHGTEPKFFTTEHVTRLETLADHISIALANSRHYQLAVKSAHRLTTLHEASHRVVAASRNPEQVYAAIHQAVDRLLPCDAFVISMDLDEPDTVQMVYAYEEGRYHQPRELPAATSLSGKVIRGDKTVLIHDQHRVDEQVGQQLSNSSDQRSVIAVPVRIEDRILGMLSVQSLQPDVYDEEDQYLLEMFATLAAAAINNARLIEEMNRHLKYLEITNKITQFGLQMSEPATLLEKLADSLVELLGADGCYISMWDDNNQLAIPVGVFSPYQERYSRLRPEPGEPTLTQAVLQEGKPIAVEDVFDSPYISPRIAAIFPSKSMLGIPLIVDQTRYGAILIGYNNYHQFTEEEINQASNAASQVSLALAHISLLNESQQHAKELSNLYEITTDLAGIQNLPNLLRTTIEKANSLLHVSYGGIFLVDPQRDDLVLTMSIDGIPPIGSRFGINEGFSGQVIEKQKAVSLINYHEWEGRVEDFDTFQITSILGVPMSYAGKLLGVLAIYEIAPTTRKFSQSDGNLLSLFAGQVAGAVHSARLFEQTNKRLQELETISTISATLRTGDTLTGLMPDLLIQTIQLMDSQAILLALCDSDEKPLIVAGAEGMWKNSIGFTIFPNMNEINKIFSIANSFDFENIKQIPLLSQQSWMSDVNSIAGVPLIAQGRVFGLLILGRTTPPFGHANNFSQDDVRLLKAIGDISANAIRRADFHQQTQLHLERFTALHEIERAISASFDLNLTLEILLGRLTTQLEVDAASILMLNESVFELTHAASRGFRTPLITQTNIRLGEGPAGLAALERKVISMPDLDKHFFLRQEMLAAENFRAYYSIPLIAKGQVKGVLEIFHQQPLVHDPNWEDFMMTLATQAAIAIDNATLFSEVTRSNLELTLAYDATIEGWSAALELRDMETEGHSQRVTELTVTLARQMGVDEDDIVHVRRGALLHDIGKMGIPDSILHKPGPLDDDEWKIMRQHPLYAFNLLSRIEYLQQALDIPLSHHEKWNGTGYPYGLSRDKIPLPARIFAVIDVWDALSHDRPYRKAWEHDRIISYIQEESGKHFDPQVVDTFMELIQIFDQANY